MPIVTMAVEFGVKEIDENHLHLVELLNKAYDDFREGTCLPRAVIDELRVYASAQLAYEERYMADISYPDLAEHREEHAIFTTRITHLQKNHGNNADTSVETIWFLCNWVTHHIRETDAKLVCFIDALKSKQISVGAL